MKRLVIVMSAADSFDSLDPVAGRTDGATLPAQS
jgi:hypothetical protein